MVAHPGVADTATAALAARPSNVMNCRRLMAQTTSASNNSWEFTAFRRAPAVRSAGCEALHGDRSLASRFTMVVSGAHPVHRTLVLSARMCVAAEPDRGATGSRRLQQRDPHCTSVQGSVPQRVPFRSH